MDHSQDFKRTISPSPMADKTDPSRTFQMRVRKFFMDKIDSWRREQEDLPPQAETIRRLVEQGLEADQAETKKRR